MTDEELKEFIATFGNTQFKIHDEQFKLAKSTQFTPKCFTLHN